jgi:hypothetical protein
MKVNSNIYVFKFNLYRILRRVHRLNLRTGTDDLMHELEQWITPPLFPPAAPRRRRPARRSRPARVARRSSRAMVVLAHLLPVSLLLLLLLLLLQLTCCNSPLPRLPLANPSVGCACEATLGQTCGAARARSVFDCAQCCGEHQQRLLAAGCTNSEIAAWCARQATGCPCQMEVGVEGKRPPQYLETAAADVAECCDNCAQDRRCRFWSFKASDVGIGIPCRQFDALPVLNKSSGAFVSGTAPDARPAPTRSKVRLKVNGSKLIDLQTGNAVRLVGFNWQMNHLKSGDGALMKQLLPNTNMARIVGVLWDNLKDGSKGQWNSAGELGGNDCMTSTTPFWKEDCFKTLDNAVRQATEAKVWVVLAARAEFGAGENYDDPGSTVFHNQTLREQFLTMWRHVVAHYASWDYIAAYEVMAEPRDKLASPDTIRSFYQQACGAVQSVEAETPCMVGPGPYYKLWRFDDSILLHNNPNVVYTFDYFEPTDYCRRKTGKRSPVPTYPGQYTCAALVGPWAWGQAPTPTQPIPYNTSKNVCPDPHRQGDQTVGFNSSWHQQNFANWAVALRRHADVPVVVNQWEVSYGVSAAEGRYIFMSDVARELQRLDIGWAWWVWRGGGQPVDGSSGFVWNEGASTHQDSDAIAAVTDFMWP